MPVHQKAPRRAIGHWKPYYFNNSGPGLRLTARRGIEWHDFDHGLTLDGYWRIGHGNPEKVFFKGKRMRAFRKAVVDKMRFNGYVVGRPSRLYRLAKRLGRRIEIEPKGGDPRYLDARHWKRLAALCAVIFGDNWNRHFYVKMLDNHGVVFAVGVIKAASAAGFHAGPTRDWNIPDRML